MPTKFPLKCILKFGAAQSHAPALHDAPETPPAAVQPDEYVGTLSVW